MQLLRKRFEDNEILYNHIRSKVNTKNMFDDFKYSLRELSDDLQMHLRSLESLVNRLNSGVAFLII